MPLTILARPISELCIEVFNSIRKDNEIILELYINAPSCFRQSLCKSYIYEFLATL